MDGIFYNIGQFDVNAGIGSEILHLMRVREQEWLWRWRTPGRFGAPPMLTTWLLSWSTESFILYYVQTQAVDDAVKLSSCCLQFVKMFPNIENNMLCCQIWLTQTVVTFSLDDHLPVTAWYACCALSVSIIITSEAKRSNNIVNIMITKLQNKCKALTI